VVDMIQNTSTSYAPWTIVEANDKLFARIRALSTIVEALEKGLGVKSGKGKKKDKEKDKKEKKKAKDED